MNIYQIYSNVSASTDAAAYVEIARPSHILGVQYRIFGDCDADGEEAHCEVSLVPYSQKTVNDAHGPILQLGVFAVGPTDVGVYNAVDQGFVPLNLKVVAQQRIYHNWVVSSGVIGRIHTMLYTDV